MKSRRVALAAAILAGVAALLVLANFGFSATQCLTSGGFWGSGPAIPKDTRFAPERADLLLQGGPLFFRGAVRQALYQGFSDPRQGGPLALAEHPEAGEAARPLLSVEIIQRRMTWLLVWCRASALVKWGYASEGALPEMIFEECGQDASDGAWSLAPGPYWPADGCEAWVACGVVDLKLSAWGLFTKGYVESQLASLICTHIKAHLAEQLVKEAPASGL